MKKLLLGMLILVTSVTFGQDTTQSKITIAIEGGPSISTLRHNTELSDMVSVISKVGLNCGLRLEYSFSNWLSYNVSINYSQKGAEYSIYDTDESGSLIYDTDGKLQGLISSIENFNYITVPLTARFKFGGKHKFTTNLGVYGSYLINSYSLTTSSYYDIKDIKDATSDYYDTLDFGLVFGIGGDFKITNKIGITLDVSDNLGLYNVGLDTFEDYTIKHNSVNILLGLTYKL